MLKVLNFKELYNIYNHICNMINDRGYEVHKKLLSFEKFKDKYKIGLIEVVNKQLNLTVYLWKKHKFIKNDFKSVISHHKYKNKSKDMIIVTNQKINPNKYRNSGFDIVFMHTNEFLIHLTKHDYVPEHILLDETESIGDIKSLPKTLNTDPIARWYGAKPGDVFKIIRRNKNTVYDVTNDLEHKKNIIEVVYNEVISL